MEVIKHGRDGAGTGFKQLFSLNFLLQAKISTSLPMGTTSEIHRWKAWLIRYVALKGDLTGLPSSRSSFRAVLMVTKSFSWDGLEFGGEMPLLSFWSTSGASDDETASEAVLHDLRHHHCLCMDVLIGRRLEANLNKNTLHNYERLNQVGLIETAGARGRSTLLQLEQVLQKLCPPNLLDTEHPTRGNSWVTSWLAMKTRPLNNPFCLTLGPVG